MDNEKIDLMALGQVIDTSFGRPSTPRGATFSIKFQILGTNTMKVAYNTLVNYGSEKEMYAVKAREANSADELIKNAITSVKSLYKEATGKSIKIKSSGDPADSTELIGNPGNPRKTVLFRRVVLLEVS